MTEPSAYTIVRQEQICHQLLMSRIKVNKSQRDIKAKTALSLGTIVKIENPEGRRIHLDSVLRYADALDLDLVLVPREK
jgi:hypothetical protein